MVLGVCRRILRNSHDSDDAFQATFLVLAQKARSVLNRHALASWLYTVAFRTALHAKKRNARRQRKETQVDNMPHPESAPREPHDWHVVLDQELNLLPEKYRAPIILCDLEGRMRREAARQLGIAEGTLASRLATARRMLAKRLARHGISLSAGALATALGSQAAAAVPATLVMSTAKAAAGQFAVSSSVAVLVKGALTAMYLSKLKMFSTVLVVAVLGAGTIFYGSGAAQAPSKAKPRSELETLREENELLKINLRVTLEKIRSLENEIAGLKGSKDGVRTSAIKALEQMTTKDLLKALNTKEDAKQKPRVHALSDWLRWQGQPQDLDPVLKALRGAEDVLVVPENREAIRRVREILEDAAKKLRQQERPAPKDSKRSY
jgi:RNA polymerase sigma factor (sigma-70 family)